jgi:hypothetical protein
MSIRVGLLCYLPMMAVVLVAAGPPARGNAPPTCWRTIDLAGNEPVALSRTGDGEPELVFRAGFEVPVRVPGSAETPAVVPAGTMVELSESVGQVAVRAGPLELSRGDERYAVPADPRGLDLRLSALQGTRIELPTGVSDGMLPADTSAAIVLDGPVEAELAAPVNLAPIPPDHPSAWLDPGALPITRGGRLLQVELYAPGWNQSQLSAEAFQACFYRAPNDPRAAATLVSLVSARDGGVTLAVLVPDGFDEHLKFYTDVKSQILGPMLGILSDEQSVYVGNPVYAFIVSILVVLGLLVLIARLLPSDVTVGGILKKLISFTIGTDGQPSLSLFQIYIWTALVLAGMLYVFFMSGDLLNISQQVLVLVGLAGVGSIGARWIGTGASGTGPATGSGFWGMFVVDGKPDLLRLQLFLFTLTIWVYVAARVFYEQAFPELDPNVLLLMGISNGVYVGGKWAATAAPAASPRKVRPGSDVSRRADEDNAAEVGRPATRSKRNEGSPPG